MKFLITLAVCIAMVHSAYGQCTDACAPACLNGGVRDPNSCGCNCATGYQGPQCQYATDPCAVIDSPACEKMNCYNGTSDAFFGCQAKCLCCKNKQCYNGGRVTGSCTCACFSINGAASKYDAATDCRTVLAGQCSDDTRCSTQFGTTALNNGNCQFDFVRYACPLSCGVCTA